MIRDTLYTVSNACVCVGVFVYMCVRDSERIMCLKGIKTAGVCVKAKVRIAARVNN